MALIAELAQAGKEAPIAWKDAALSLQGFQQHRHRAIAVLLQRGLKAVDVVVIEVGKALRQGLKTAVVFRLAGGGHRCQGSAVEAGAGCEDQWLADAAAAVAVLARQLDGGLIGFSA